MLNIFVNIRDLIERSETTLGEHNFRIGKQILLRLDVNYIRIILSWGALYTLCKVYFCIVIPLMNFM